MSKIILNPKTYVGQDLAQTFFRPVLSGDSAVDLGIRVMYNMPMPTTLNLWQRASNALRSYQKGWDGGDTTYRFQKTIDLKQVKAEMSYSAADYFSMVYEQLVASDAVNLTDLSDTMLEKAETELFRNTIAESIRATMWVGDADRSYSYNTFTGLLKRIKDDIGNTPNDIRGVPMLDMSVEGNAESLLSQIYEKSQPQLKHLKAEGRLAFFVTRDVYENYETGLLEGNLDSVRSAKINGIDKLYFRGIEIVDMGIDEYLYEVADMPKNWAILTDRHNLVMAVNTADFPGSQISMWYNEDELENRQRAVFMAGCDYLMPELVVASHTDVL